MKLYTKTQKSHDTLLIFGKTLTTIQLTFWLETLSEEQKPRVFDKTFLGLNHRFLRRCYKSQKPYRQDRNDWTAQNFPSKKTQASCHNPIYRIHLPGLGHYPKTGCRDSLGLKMKISKLVGDEILLETQFYESVRLERKDPVDQKNLLEKLKQGISNCIKWGC